MKSFNQLLRGVSRFFLYGVVFALIAFVTSLIPGSNYTHTPPVASADVPYQGGDGGPDGGDGADGSDAGDACDGSSDAGSDACDGSDGSDGL